MAEQLVGSLGYLGIVLVLVLGGLGLPVPEEAPILLGGVLAHRGQLHPLFAFAASLVGVLLGDFVVFGLGYWHGPRVLNLRLMHQVLSRPRLAQIEGYFARHGTKILVLSRFAPGFRTAAYLSAGILRMPPLRLLGADLVAAGLSTSLLFSLGYYYSHYIESTLAGMRRYGLVLAAASILGVVLYRFLHAYLRGGQPVGPPVPIEPEVPLPPDDLARDWLAPAPLAPADPHVPTQPTG